MTPRTYIKQLVLYTLLLAGAILVLNFTADPYAITGAVRIPHYNQYKVDINNYTRLSKKYQPLQSQHNALIIGNSRVEMGINPAHRCFVESGWTVYNLGMPGAGLRSQLAYALNVMYQQPIERVFLSVDFSDFLSSPKEERRLPSLLSQSSAGLAYLPSGKLNPDYTKTKLFDYYKSLFSLDGLVSSLVTIASQSSAAPDRDRAGFNPARDFARSVRLEGPAALFDQKLQALQQKYSRHWYLRNSAGALNQSFDDLVLFLAIADDLQVEVNIFTNPFHESYWSLMQANRLMPLYKDWMKSMEALIRASEAEVAGFWHFSVDSPHIHEPIPLAGVKTGPLKWFWEPAHYRSELGDLMIEAMLSESCGTDVVFGRKLF